ncbi:MAG: alpha/beta hydrolase [Pirellulaceae bacterium]
MRIACLCLLFTLSADVVYAQTFHVGRAPAPEAGSMYVYPERIRLKSREFFTAHRGQMFVPINRSQEDSAVISVEFYRFPRNENANPQTPPLFILNGGPGFPGLSDRLGKRGLFEEQFQGLLDITDVVVVGQRCIGSSTPNTVISQPTPPQLAKQDDSEAVAEFQQALRNERQYWLDQGVDLAGLSVVEAAVDVRDLAHGLGYDKIIISGGSFGSHWGMTLLRFHPDLIARAVLHGMEGPDHTWDHPGWIWNVYKRVAADAEASEALAGLIPEGGLVAAMEKMVSDAEANPIKFVLNEGAASETEVLLDGYALRSVARGYSGGNLNSWPAEVIQMSRGELLPVARRVMALSRFRGRNFTTASYWALDSGSGITAERRAAFESDPAMQIIGSTFSSYAMGSPVWEVDLGDEFRADFETDIPVVIVHGTWDTSTPYENAQELAPFFSNSRFVTVERGSHGAIREARDANPEFRAALATFIETGDMSGLPERVELDPPSWKLPESATDADK